MDLMTSEHGGDCQLQTQDILGEDSTLQKHLRNFAKGKLDAAKKGVVKAEKSKKKEEEEDKEDEEDEEQEEDEEDEDDDYDE
ncbi:hypothetical protein TREES_T100017303 [Tupaia chinensis]|uniref:Uncharacterized protein n=1 Tax=Tupaia chinensis TaxID=246437 RepID=L9JC16_TUPCH|nr:hypothetical protein TREES_T100017303 [Tupaia chinensis]